MKSSSLVYEKMTYVIKIEKFIRNNMLLEKKNVEFTRLYLANVHTYKSFFFNENSRGENILFHIR